jgi:hypothetical protein
MAIVQFPLFPDAVSWVGDEVEVGWVLGKMKLMGVLDGWIVGYAMVAGSRRK